MTQSRLLDIAIREFGQKGLDGASTRGIAKAAGTAMSSITYHFGGKEGLYLAAADYIAEQMGDEMGAAFAAMPDGDAPDAETARARLHTLLAAFTAKMLDEKTADWTLFILREQMKPTEAFDRIYAGMMGQVFRRIARLVAQAAGLADAPDPMPARMAAITLMGQMMAIRASRAACLRLLERDAVDPEVSAALSHRIAANTDAIIASLRGEHRANPPATTD